MDASRRDIMRWGAAAGVAAVALPLAGWAVGTPAIGQAFADVDPEMVDDLRLIREMVVNAGNLNAFRHRPPSAHAHPAPIPPGGDAPVETKAIPGLPGEPPVNAVVFDGAPDRKDKAALIWIHGGGYVAGSAGIGPAVRAAAREHGWLVVSPDYRLAPEATYKGSVADNYAALRWVHDQAATLGVDRSRIAVGGSSAGGGHAAMLALAARDRGEVKLAYQVLIYPMLDDRTASTRPARPGTGRYIWTGAANRFGWQSMLGQAPGTDTVPTLAVPGRRTDLAGLPPAFIGVGTLDLFLDEDLAYADALTRANVPVDLAIVPAAFHAFDGIAPMARASQAFTARWIADLAQALKRG